MKFPGKPHFELTPLVTVNHDVLQRLGAKKGTQGVLKEVNMSFESEFQETFTESLVRHGGAGLQVKSTSTQRKRKLREICRRCRETDKMRH